MNECRIEKTCKGPCFECGQEKGVCFRIGFAGDVVFLCWEHFRLLQESLRPQRVVPGIVRIVEECPCCCPLGRHRHGRTVYQSVTQTIGQSESRTETSSEARSSGTSETRDEGGGKSHGTSTGSSGGEAIP